MLLRRQLVNILLLETQRAHPASGPVPLSAGSPLRLIFTPEGTQPPLQPLAGAWLVLWPTQLGLRTRFSRSSAKVSRC